MRLEIIRRTLSNKTQKRRSLVIAMLAGLLVIFWVHEPGGMVGAVEAKSLEPDECSANIPINKPLIDQDLSILTSFYRVRLRFGP